MSEKKIKLPEELQREMLEFFFKTSIPKKKKIMAEQEKFRLLSENEKTDRREENESKNGNLCSS